MKHVRVDQNNNIMTLHHTVTEFTKADGTCTVRTQRSHAMAVSTKYFEGIQIKFNRTESVAQNITFVQTACCPIRTEIIPWLITLSS